jgi:23S rRNA A1618 N6-methylase RlmF
MCNPPFFADLAEAKSEENGRCVATVGELVTKGGEIEFVGKMIEESKDLGQQVTWYTSMLGKKASLKPLLEKAREAGAVQILHTPFLQGRQGRWCICWSFLPPLKGSSILQISKSTPPSRPPTMWKVQGSTAKGILEIITSHLRSQTLPFKVDPLANEVMVSQQTM